MHTSDFSLAKLPSQQQQQEGDQRKSERTKAKKAQSHPMFALLRGSWQGWSPCDKEYREPLNTASSAAACDHQVHSLSPVALTLWPQRMGKNQAYKSMQRARYNSGSGSNAPTTDDGEGGGASSGQASVDGYVSSCRMLLEMWNWLTDWLMLSRGIWAQREKENIPLSLCLCSLVDVPWALNITTDIVKSCFNSHQMEEKAAGI